MATAKTVLVFISCTYLFSCPVLCLESGETRSKRVRTTSSTIRRSTFRPESFLKKNVTLLPNLLMFGPEFQRTPKRLKKIVKNVVSTNETSFLPKMMIFEPDKLFWPFTVETDVVPPFGMMSYQPTTKRRRTKGSSFSSSSANIQLIDRNKTTLQIYPNLLDIFGKLQKKDIKIAVAETTQEIATIRHLLHLFDIDYIFPHMAIDLDSAVEHVKEIKRDSGLEFSDLVYFGFNKSSLNEIKRELKVLTIHVKSDDGLNLMHIYKAIYLYNVRPLMTSIQGKLHLTEELLPDELLEDHHLMTTQIIKMKPSRKPRTPRMRISSGNTTSKPIKYPRTKRKA